MRSPNTFILPAVLLLAGCAIPPERSAAPARPTASPLSPRASETAYATMESRIFALVNAERARHGIPALAWNERLDLAARLHAENMARFKKMAHVLPESPLPTLTLRAQHVSYYYSMIAENIAIGFPDAESVVRGWMESPGHRQSILSRETIETGTAVVRSSSGGLYFCQVFGRPRTHT